MNREINIDDVIQMLWDSRQNPSKRRVLDKAVIKALINGTMEIMKKQPVFLELIPPITLVGDIHGQFSDLLRIFETGGSPDSVNYLFLGDYVDRGNNSINVMCLLMAYKIKYPNNFFLLRGNHESAGTNRDYGFYAECQELYSVSLWKSFNQMFDWMPVTAIIDSRILCVHGGISPDLKSINDLRKIQRPTDIPEDGLLCDLVWSDPDPSVELYGPNDRQTSCVFGKKPTRALLDKLQLDLIVRAHQAIDNGYDFPFIPDRSIVTVFSAPNYGMMGNKAAIMHISKKMSVTFSIIHPKK